MNPFASPHTRAATPPVTFEFHPGTVANADILLTADPVALYRRLLRDQESETVLLAARRVLHGFLSRPAARGNRPPADPEAIAAWVGQARELIAAILADLERATPPVREAVLRQRAPLALLGGCWLDVVSQPATQPAMIVNRLLEQQFVLRGAGRPRQGLHHLRQRALEAAEVYLPDVAAEDFMRLAEARPLTALHGSFYLSLAKLPANFLPEVIGVHYAVCALGVDDLLLGTEPMLAEPELRAVLAEYLAGNAPDVCARVVRAVELAVTLELEHAGMLAHLAAWRDGRLREAAPNRIGDREAAVWRRGIAGAPPRDIVLRPAEAPDHRTFLHRLVNIENYPNTVALAREHATVVLTVAEEAMFEHGGTGALTDATWFEYTPDALLERVDEICCRNRTNGHHVAILEPMSVALAGLTAGACAHRIGTVGRYLRPSDGTLYAGYAEEMGRGDPRANQVALSHRLLGRVGIRVPHLCDATPRDLEVLSDDLCQLAIQQLCLGLFPDTFYDEILGFRLGITMCGLGRRRVHDARRHGLDLVDTEPPPTADDTVDAARRSAAIIVGYLDGVGRACGADALRARWRRVWRGYASFAYLVEPEPLGSVIGDAPAEPEVRPRSRFGRGAPTSELFTSYGRVP